MTARQLCRHQYRTGGQVGAFHVFAADAQKVVIGDAVSLVELATEAAFLERALWQYRRCARGGDQHRIGLGGHYFEHLTGHRRVGAVVAFVGHNL